MLSAVSRMPEDLSGMTLYAVTNYEVSSPVRFNLSIARFHTAISQANSPLRSQYAVVVNGGQAGAILVRPAENWALQAVSLRTVASLPGCVRVSGFRALQRTVGKVRRKLQQGHRPIST